jgi:hypothetical protein
MSICRTPLRLVVLLAALGGTAPASRAEPPAGQKLDAPALAWAIDRHVQKRLDEAKVPASGPADDAEFLRRVYLDLHGVIPPADKAVAFLDSTDPDKRAKVIDELLASPRYGQYQTDIWASVLYRIILERRYSPPRELMVRWLEESFNANKPWDRMAHELITASGTSGHNGAVAYLVHTKGVRPLEEVTNLTARVFLGRADLKCAQCHNHPFISFKQTDYWGLAAFFSQLEVVRDPTYKGLQNGNLGLGDRRGPPVARKDGVVPDGFKDVPPRFPEGEQPRLDASVPYRKALADWVTSPSNPFFARAMVNRTWAHLFGRGFVNPIDEMNETNPPTHPELLALLAEQFAANGFDLKYLLRAICNSQTYQRSSRTMVGNGGDTELYSHMPIKVLSPRQLFDSLERMAPLSDGARKGRDSFIASFGSLDSTDGELPDPAEYTRSMAQQLRLMTANPPFQNLPGNLVKQTAPPGRPPSQVIEGLYLTVLSRRPSARELERAVAFVQDRGAAGYTELARVLLTTSEFALNH